MVLGIVAIMTIVATAFLMFMSQSYRAAANTQFTAQAELAARSGLEHAIRAIQESVDLYVCRTYAIPPDRSCEYRDPADDADGDGDPDGAKVGWYRYFEGNEPIIEYRADRVIQGRRLQVGSPIVQMEYAVRVYDLDGFLHASLPQWTDGQASAESQVRALIAAVAGIAGLSGDERQALSGQSSGMPFSSMGELARRSGAARDDTKYDAEQMFTVYPLIRSDFQESSDAVSGETTIALRTGGLEEGHYERGTVFFPGSATRYPVVANDASTVTVLGVCTGEDGNPIRLLPARPAVNINTVSRNLLLELIHWIPVFGTMGNRKDGLAKYLIAEGPFTGRFEFEEAMRRASGGDGIVDLHDYNPVLDEGTHLMEREFNDFLNNTAGVLAEEDSAYDEPGNPGVYSFDGWSPFYDEPPGDPKDDDGAGSQQTGGNHSAPDGTDSNVTGDAAHNLTWSTEFKFTSRFFHIYVLGRGWNPETNRARGVRRLHAIYDAEGNGKIIWLRWNLSNRGSVSDIH
jgi:hypothetical protein